MYAINVIKTSMDQNATFSTSAILKHAEQLSFNQIRYHFNLIKMARLTQKLKKLLTLQQMFKLITKKSKLA